MHQNRLYHVPSLFVLGEGDGILQFPLLVFLLFPTTVFIVVECSQEQSWLHVIWMKRGTFLVQTGWQGCGSPLQQMPGHGQNISWCHLPMSWFGWFSGDHQTRGVSGVSHLMARWSRSDSGGWRHEGKFSPCPSWMFCKCLSMEPHFASVMSVSPGSVDMKDQ